MHTLIHDKPGTDRSPPFILIASIIHADSFAETYAFRKGCADWMPWHEILPFNRGVFPYPCQKRNMKPTDEEISKFQRIYFEEFGESINRDEAYEKLLRLINVLRVILLPDLPNKNDEDQSAAFDRKSEKC